MKPTMKPMKPEAESPAEDAPEGEGGEMQECVDQMAGLVERMRAMMPTAKAPPKNRAEWEDRIAEG